MIFRTTLTVAALMMSGTAYAQTPVSQPANDRVIVTIAGKSPTTIRHELLRASEAVCRFDTPLGAATDEGCVAATYQVALRRAKLGRTATSAAAVAATRVASR